MNEAEYHALITGLKAAIELGIQDIRVRGDSNLIVSQVKGDWKVKEPRLIPLHAECNEMKKKFRRFDIAHVRREFNKDADALANSAIDDGTHTNDYEYKMSGSGGGGFNGGGGEGLGGGNVNAAARMVATNALRQHRQSDVVYHALRSNSFIVKRCITEVNCSSSNTEDEDFYSTRLIVLSYNE